MLREPFDEAGWSEVKGPDAEGFLKQLVQAEPDLGIKPASTRVHWRTVPYFKDVGLIRVTLLGWHPAPLTLWYLGHGGKLIKLDGTARPLLSVCETSLILNASTVIAYLKAFCWFVQADGRPFRVVESVEDLDLISPVDAARAAKIKAAIGPARIIKADAEGGYDAQACVMHGDTLYSCRFHLDSDGMTTMIGDDEIAAGLPVMDAVEVA